MQGEDGKDRRVSEKVLWCITCMELLLMGTVEKGQPIPTWLDHEFLYSLNYGTTEPDVLKKTERSHCWVLRDAPISLTDKHFETRRTGITLMDRSLAAKLQNRL